MQTPETAGVKPHAVLCSGPAPGSGKPRPSGPLFSPLFKEQVCRGDLEEFSMSSTSKRLGFTVAEPGHGLQVQKNAGAKPMVCAGFLSKSIRATMGQVSTGMECPPGLGYPGVPAS